MNIYEIFDHAIELKVKTRRPSKWLLIDRETGQVYQGNPNGYWDKMDPVIKDKNGSTGSRK